MQRNLFLISAFFLIFTLVSAHLSAQRVGINILTPDTSAILHLESDSLGFLPPRMNTAQRDDIINPATGLVIYNTEDSTVQYYNGVCWLAVYQRSCDDCIFNVNPSSLADTINRVFTDSVTFTLDVTQTNGFPQNIAFSVVNPLPQDMRVDIQPNPQFSSGTATVTIKVTPFTPEGTYPVIISVICGSSFYNIIYSVTLTPCYFVEVVNNTVNYNLGTAFYAQFPSVPVSEAVCVVNQIRQGVDITSNNAALPAYTTGNLNSGSNLAIVNNGNVIGRGGNGGTAFNPAQGTTGEGFNGGHAINLTLPATIINNFNIYGGGGGGSAMAFALSFNLPAGLPPLGILIGAGGGGGAGNGQGGNIPNLIGLSFYNPGFNGTGGQFGGPGNGGLLVVPISINQGPVAISINPYTQGGQGGPYGGPGATGVFNVSISIAVVINIPFVGPVTIPVVSNLQIPIPVPIPAPGQGGFAIKRNGNATNIPDNVYNNAFLKGRVAN